METSMTATSSLSGGLRDFYAGQSARIQQQFESTGDGRAMVAARTRLVEEIVHRLWQEHIAPGLNGPPASLSSPWAASAAAGSSLTPTSTSSSSTPTEMAIPSKTPSAA